MDLLEYVTIAFVLWDKSYMYSSFLTLKEESLE